jgi:hypothetical protein
MLGTWVDEVLPMEPFLTNGRSSIRVENHFESSDLDINEFYYALHCLPNGTSWSNPRYGSSQNWTLMDVLNVGPNNPNDEKGHKYTITNQTWNGVRYYRYNGTRGSQAAQSLELISNLYLTLSFDGQETVNAPVGSFFGSGLGKFDVRSLMLSIDTMMDNGPFTSWWPMPFTQSTTVGLVNKGNGTVHGSVDLVWADWADPSSCSADASSGGNATWGYFSTQYNRSETVTGEYWNFLSTQGRGVAYGVSHALGGAILPPSNTLAFLEGNEEVWANEDGKQGPFTDATMHGTGTEDFYESGWYFTDAQDGPYGSDAVPFAMPFTGMPAHEIQELDCPGECVAAYRQMLPDSMAFELGMSFNIQHGPVDNDINANYESTAYYYRAR